MPTIEPSKRNGWLVRCTDSPKGDGQRPMSTKKLPFDILQIRFAYIDNHIADEMSGGLVQGLPKKDPQKGLAYGTDGSFSVWPLCKTAVMQTIEAVKSGVLKKGLFA